MSWDVEGAYLLADQDDFVLVKFTGESVDVLCQVDAGYEEFVTYEKGKKVLYLELLKALYVYLRSALLWYKLYSTKLQGMGFILNLYDTCVANKDIEGKQCTIGYYVDDNVATHDCNTVLQRVADIVATEVGNITITTGNKHNFLGMDLVFHDDGTLTIDMSDYVLDALKDFPDKLRKAAASPARPDLFYLDHSSPRLSKHKSDLFHSLVMKLMWVS